MCMGDPGVREAFKTEQVSSNFWTNGGHGPYNCNLQYVSQMPMVTVTKFGRVVVVTILVFVMLAFSSLLKCTL